MNNNEQPKYVLKFNETVRKTVKDINYRIKMAVIIIIAGIKLGSIIFQKNLFKELNPTARITLICLVMRVMFTGKTENINSPIEIRFFDDYLIIYREKRFYSEKVSRKEFNKFLYNDITNCEFDSNRKRFNFIGKIDATWYDYNKYGGLPQNPTYHRIVDGGICYFYTVLEPELDIIKEIEIHSPIKVKFI